MSFEWELDYHVEDDSDAEGEFSTDLRYPSSSEDELERSLGKDFGSMENELNKVKEVSDSENQGTQTSSNSRCKITELESKLSNDDLLYDPEMDDEDQKWVDKERSRNRNILGVRGMPVAYSVGERAGSFKSDAILSCPACMTTVCIDCQRHEVYKSQYRAMFVMNVHVVKDEILRYEVRKSNSKKKKRRNNIGNLVRETSSESPDSHLDYEKYNPVKCKECGTEVAVFDHEEVYHFFNILASQA